jgi:hypothetical protein
MLRVRRKKAHEKWDQRQQSLLHAATGADDDDEMLHPPPAGYGDCESQYAGCTEDRESASPLKVATYALKSWLLYFS